MRLQLALAMVLVFSVAEAAQMYRWVDENGVTHYSHKRPEQGGSGQPDLSGGRPGSSDTDITPERGKFFNNSTRLQQGGWQGCDSALCRLVKQLDPGCATSMCSDARRYSEDCRSAACQTNRLVFERDMRARLAREEALRNPPPRAAPEPPRAPTKRVE